jgi:hypothetical protein
VPDRGHKLAGTLDTPPPNPGGYGPFPLYACQAPNGVVVGKLWITEFAVDSPFDFASRLRVVRCDRC